MLKSIIKRIFVVMVGLACLTIIAYVVLVVYMLTPPLRSFSRAHENLPTVSVEAGDTVYCRMRYCDFRFPLPRGAFVVQTNIDSRGFDTIYGTVYILGTNGESVNLRDYAELLQKRHFSLSIADASCCCPTNTPDEPFTNAGVVIHHPDLSGFMAGSSDQVGGCLQIETTDNLTHVRFSYFGDY